MIFDGLKMSQLFDYKHHDPKLLRTSRYGIAKYIIDLSMDKQYWAYKPKKIKYYFRHMLYSNTIDNLKDAQIYSARLYHYLLNKNLIINDYGFSRTIFCSDTKDEEKWIDAQNNLSVGLYHYLLPIKSVKNLRDFFIHMIENDIKLDVCFIWRTMKIIRKLSSQSNQSNQSSENGELIKCHYEFLYHIYDTEWIKQQRKLFPRYIDHLHNLLNWCDFDYEDEFSNKPLEMLTSLYPPLGITVEVFMLYRFPISRKEFEKFFLCQKCLMDGFDQRVELRFNTRLPICELNVPLPPSPFPPSPPSPPSPWLAELLESSEESSEESS